MHIIRTLRSYSVFLIALPTLLSCGSETPEMSTRSSAATGGVWAPLVEADGGPSATNISWNYTMGYHFTPQVDGYVTHVGGLFNGACIVRLYDRASGAELGSRTVSSYNEFEYQPLYPPVAVTQGSQYTVAVFLDWSGGSYRSAAALPRSSNGVQIDTGTYAYGDARPTNAYNVTMYGMADIRFTTEPPGPDTEPPTVTLTSPTAGHIPTTTVLLLSADADDNHSVVSVEFYIDGALAGFRNAPPYSMPSTASQWGNGLHEVYAVARDASGNTAQSAVVNFEINLDTTPPTVEWVAPAEGAELSGLVTLTTLPSDDQEVGSVYYYVDSNYIGNALEPYTYVWDSSSVGPGVHTLGAVAYDRVNNASPLETREVVVLQPPPQPFTAPVCDTVQSVCSTGGAVVSLVNGRSTKGPEPNYPNTLDACADGSYGGYHKDESLDAIRISTLDGSGLGPGKTVEAEFDVWAWAGYTSDRLDVFVAADANAPSWQWVATITPTRANFSVITTTFTLPASTASHMAVRGQFRYGGSAAPCASGGYNDRDDLVFAVQ